MVASQATAFAVTAPRDLLPELAADLELLRTIAEAAPEPVAAALAGHASQLAAMAALTHTCLGRSRPAARWWRTARETADASGDRQVRSTVRSWEVLSGLAGRRPLADLLLLADEAAALAPSATCAAAALGCRAQVLAGLGETDSAEHALRRLAAVSAEVRASGADDGPLVPWASYRLHYVDSYVRTAAGDTAAAYEAQERALELCRPEHGRERAELHLQRAQCFLHDGEVAAGLATALRVLVEAPDHCHTEFLYDAGARVLSAVPAAELGRPAVRELRYLLVHRPYQRR